MAEERKSAHVCSKIPSLPRDVLVTNILPRLSSRTLVQFKCVSKSSRSLISSSEFINLHLRFHPLLPSSTNRILVFVTRKGGDDDGDQCLHTLALDSRKPRAMNVPVPQALCTGRNKQNFCQWGNDHSIYAVGSCNGMVCLGFPWSESYKMWGEYFMFLNPLTGMFSYDKCFKKDDIRGYDFATSFGFGNDGNNDDYKLVAVTDEYNYRRFGTKACREVMVYSMKANSWKRVEATTNQFLRQKLSTRGVVVHNHLVHWLFIHISTLLLQIACFDLENEQWTAHSIPLPDSPFYSKNFDDTLGVLDDRLCLMVRIWIRSRTDVWVMKEYGVQSSWMKLFTITGRVPNTVFLYPYLRRKTKKQLLLNLNLPQQGGERCLWYKFREKTTKELKFKGAPSSFKALTLCFESL